MGIYGPLFLLFVFVVGAAGQSGCPSVSIVGPTGLMFVDDPAPFEARLSGDADASKLRFIWTASGGRIRNPFQGRTMDLKPERADGGTNIHVSVRVEGLPTGCTHAAWDIVGVHPYREPHPADRFPAMPLNEVRARVDNYFIMLGNEPTYRAIFELRFAKTESSAERLRRVNRIVSAIKLRNYDVSRLTFAVQNCESVFGETVLWVEVPSGKAIEFPKAKLIPAAELMRNPKKALSTRQCLCK